MKAKKKKHKYRLKKHIRQTLYNILILISILILVYSLTGIALILIDQKKNEAIYEELLKKVVTNPDEPIVDININFEELLKHNPDVIGWIIFNQEKINYPIVQAKDNNYYLNRSFDKKNNSLGSIFMDYRNDGFNSLNTIIYGHNNGNNTMFGSLKDVLKKDFFKLETNNYVTILTNDGKNIYQIFSVYTIKKGDIYSNPTPNNYQAFLKKISNRSLRKFDVNVTKEDKILTLSTCHGQRGTPNRLVVNAKLIEDNFHN